MDSDLTDSQWARLEPLLPPSPAARRGGRPRYRSRRELIDGIRWRYQSGTRWDRLPARYGPHQTTYALFQSWRKDGTWQRIAAELGSSAEAQSIIPWT
jgi:transposase